MFSRDGTRVFVGSGDKKVRVLDSETTEVLREFSGPKFAVHALAVSPDGNQLVAVARDLVVWDLRKEADPSP